MKQWMIYLLLFSLLLTGCQLQTAIQPETSTPTIHTEPNEPTQQSSEPTQQSSAPTQASSEPTQQPDVPLLEQGEQVGDSDGLLYVPNTHVESFALPQMYLFGNALLLTEHRPGANGGTRIFKLISLEDGSLMAETALIAGSSSTVQIGNGQVVLCDSDMGRITFLNGYLIPENTYYLPYAGGRWYMDQELSTVYILGSESGLVSYQLETGAESQIVSNATAFTVKGSGSGYLIFEYTDKTDLRTYTRCLNMSTGMMETLPVKGSISTASRSNNYWLIRQGGIDGTYTVINNASAGTFRWPESVVKLIPGRNHLLMSDQNHRVLSLYKTNGDFISQCTLSNVAYATVGTDFVWSGYWGGYFFVDTWDNTGHLMFWDVRKNTEGAKLAITPVEAPEPVEPVLPPELYQQAQALSQRFGLNICIAEQCTLAYSHYEASALTDPRYVREALAVLERTLSRYPEGMLKQLPYGQIEEIRIELVGDLRAKDGMGSHPVSINGFAQDLGDVYIIVLESYVIADETIYHELSHVIDKRLEWYASIHPEAMFSEEAWLAVQPEGFQYAYSYTDIPGNILVYKDSGYFVKEYSMTYPTEDRATLMAAAMIGSEGFETSAQLQAKMRFYALCIRESFDTSLWPEKTVWER